MLWRIKRDKVICHDVCLDIYARVIMVVALS